jgi:hypothetical protein
MLYKEIIAVCSDIHTKYLFTICGQKNKLFVEKLKETFKVTTGH